MFWIANFYSLIVLATFETEMQGGVISEDEAHTFTHEMSFESSALWVCSRQLEVLPREHFLNENTSGRPVGSSAFSFFSGICKALLHISSRLRFLRAE